MPLEHQRRRYRDPSSVIRFWRRPARGLGAWRGQLQGLKIDPGSFLLGDALFQDSQSLLEACEVIPLQPISAICHDLLAALDEDITPFGILDRAGDIAKRSHETKTDRRIG